MMDPLLETPLSVPKAPEFCLICKKTIPEEELTSIAEEERGKFIRIFIQCLTLDTDKLRGDVDRINFCVGCQTKLEEWEFDQEQINKLLYRASVLKATLTATLLEFSQEAERKEDCVHDEIRKLVRDEYNVRVKVKRFKFEAKTATVREPIQKLVLNLNKINNSNPRRLPRSSSPPVKKIGRCEYLYKSAIPFSYNARKYQCGLCPAVVSVSPDGFGWTYMLKHIRRFHKAAYEAAVEEETENHALNHAEDHLNINQVFQGGLWDDFVPHSDEGDTAKEQSEAAGDLSSSYDDLTSPHDDPLASHDDPSNSHDDFDPTSALQVKLDIPEDQAGNADLDDANNSMDVDIQGYPQDSSEDQSSRQSQSPMLPRHRTRVRDLGGGRYKYGPHTFTIQDGKGICNVCGQTYGGTVASARHNVVQHIRLKHIRVSSRSRSIDSPKENQTTDFTIEVQPISTTKLLFRNKNFTIEPIPSSTTTTEVPSSDISPPDTKADTTATPNFDVSKVRQTGPGEYIYRNKVPFTFSDGRFTCGFCWRIYEGNAVIAKHQLLSHLRVKHLNNSTQSATSPTKSRPEPPGIFSYKNKVQYELKDGAYHCSLCRLKFAGPVLAAAKNKLFAHIEERHAATLEDLPEIRIRTGNSIFAPEETENFPISIVTRNNNSNVVHSTVKRIGPDEFLYRNQYKFSVKNGVYHCGNCTSTYTSNAYGRHSILRHIRKNHEGKPLEPKPRRLLPATNAANVVQNGPSKPATSTATSVPSSGVPEGGSLIHKDIREVAPGRYEYEGKPFWFSNGKFGCGLCPTLWVSSVGPANILLHLKTAHAGYRPIPTVTTPSPGARTASSQSPVSPQLFPQGQSSCSVVSTTGEAVEECIGQFPSSRVQQTGPGQYLYRSKVPFSFSDGTFTCGVCAQNYGGNPLIAKHQMMSHVRVFHAGSSAEDLQNEIGGHIVVGENRIEATPTFHRLDIKELEPGKYVYRGAILFTYKDAKFTCGMCNSAFGGPVKTSMMDITQHMKAHLENRPSTSSGQQGPLVSTTTARTIQNVTQNMQLSVLTSVQQASQAPQQLRRLPPEVTELGGGKYLYRNKLFTLQRGKFWCYYCPSSWFAVVESWEALLEHLRIVHNAGATSNYPLDCLNQMNPLPGSNSLQSQQPPNYQAHLHQNCPSQLSQSITRASSPRILGQDNRAMGMPVITSVQGHHNPSMISTNPTIYSSSGLASGMSVPQLLPLNQPTMPQNSSQPRHSPSFMPQNQSMMSHNHSQPRHSPTVVTQGMSITSLVSQTQSMMPLGRPVTPQARHSPSMPPGMSIPAMVSQSQQQFMSMAAPVPSQARHSPAESTGLTSGHLTTQFNSGGGRLTDENISLTSLLSSLTSPTEYSSGPQPNSPVQQQQQQSPLQCPPVSTSSGPMLPTSSNSYLSVTNSRNSEPDTFSSANDLGDIQSYLPSGSESEFTSSMNMPPLAPILDASLGFPSLDTNTLDSSFLDLI